MSSLDKIFEGPDHIDDASVPWDNVLKEDYHVMVYLDKFPCTPGHMLFVPKYNSLSVLRDAFDDAVREGKKLVANGECQGFNIGMNYGPIAGQTVMWPHIHLILRRTGDVEDPIGGVRNTIPGMGNYKKTIKI